MGSSMLVIRFLGAALLAMASLCHAEEVRIASVMAMQSAMKELGPRFESKTGHKLIVQYATTAAVARIAREEMADAVIIARQQSVELEAAGVLTKGSATDVARFGVGMFVRKGAGKPDISTLQGFTNALLSARSIGHADPGKGGATAVYVAGLLRRLDIADLLKSKIALFPPGVYDRVADGEIEIGFGGTTEILADPRVDFVGPLPPEVQNYTTFSGAVVASGKSPAAAAQFVRFLSSPVAAEVMKAKGFEPR